MERSKAAKYAASVFYETFNDFDIYTEDTAKGYPKIIASFLSTALGSTVALDRVFPLGQRGDVIKAAKTRPQKGRRAAYIVDGDLYLLAGEREEIPDNVIVLPRYCIENFMLDEEAILDLMDEEHISKSRDSMQEGLDFTGWLTRSTASLKELFKYFAAAHHLKSGIPTVSRGYDSVYSGRNGEIDELKCKRVIDEIRTHLIEENGECKVRDALQYIEDKIDPDQCFITTYVSAKDFSLPLLILKFKTVCPTKTPHVNLKLRIAQKSSGTPFKEVATNLRRILNLKETQTAATQSI
ncbi:DUF4435 domain-containing protein [Pseudomonas asiatica]|uniref:DUF4435 domain-containing protein n=1 Tax=Pseudomonas asiatica TaxID=2219225 RepID=UPI00244CEB7D|nr:DUF4435 domain-containing protein [Pseudomonas asiatica]MDH0133548.1 DUF4435 domain-containing protein [Pseudomonas asiatica]